MSAVKISFDIGGVLSKYPQVFRPMVEALIAGGAEVYVITDMHDHDQSVKFVRGNGFTIPPGRILNADYTTHGEGCKESLIREHGIDLHIDDFPGYCAHRGCVSLMIWPNPEEPYYHDDWITDGSEGDFGRRKKVKPAGASAPREVPRVACLCGAPWVATLPNGACRCGPCLSREMFHWPATEGWQDVTWREVTP